MALWEKALVTKPDGLSTVPRPYTVEITSSSNLSSDLQMGAMAHVPTHTHKLKINVMKYL